MEPEQKVKSSFLNNELQMKTHSILDDYEVDWGSSLGAGITGPVRPCKHRGNGTELAVKCLLDRAKSRNEVLLHVMASRGDLCKHFEGRDHHHKHIVDIYDVFANDVQFPGEKEPIPRILVVMEKMKGGELFERISQQHHFTEQHAADVTRQIALAVQRCHSLNIAHRDVKPENLLLTDKSEKPTIKLSDFGFAKIDDGTLKTPQFTPYYAAPQVLEAQRRHLMKMYNISTDISPYTYDKSCDMWSVGVIIYIMLCGYPPFYSETPSKPLSKLMTKKIMTGEYNFPEMEWKNISSDAKDVVSRLLNVEPLKRMSIEELLLHPWFRSAPTTTLPTPEVLLDKDMVAEYLQAHEEQLISMRLPDHALLLKPMKDLERNKILRKRKQLKPTISQTLPSSQSSSDSSGSGGSNKRLSSARDKVAEDDAGPVAITPEPPRKQTSSQLGISQLKKLADYCLLPPPDYSSQTLSQITSSALRVNDASQEFQDILEKASWNGSSYADLEGSCGRDQLGESLSRMIGEMATTTPSSHHSSDAAESLVDARNVTGNECRSVSSVETLTSVAAADDHHDHSHSRRDECFERSSSDASCSKDSPYSDTGTSSISEDSHVSFNVVAEDSVSC